MEKLNFENIQTAKNIIDFIRSESRLIRKSVIKDKQRIVEFNQSLKEIQSLINQSNVYEPTFIGDHSFEEESDKFTIVYADSHAFKQNRKSVESKLIKMVDLFHTIKKNEIVREQKSEFLKKSLHQIKIQQASLTNNASYKRSEKNLNALDLFSKNVLSSIDNNDKALLRLSYHINGIELFIKYNSVYFSEYESAKDDCLFLHDEINFSLSEYKDKLFTKYPSILIPLKKENKKSIVVQESATISGDLLNHLGETVTQSYLEQTTDIDAPLTEDEKFLNRIYDAVNKEKIKKIEERKKYAALFSTKRDSLKPEANYIYKGDSPIIFSNETITVDSQELNCRIKFRFANRKVKITSLSTDDSRAKIMPIDRGSIFIDVKYASKQSDKISFNSSVYKILKFSGPEKPVFTNNQSYAITTLDKSLEKSNVLFVVALFEGISSESKKLKVFGQEEFRSMQFSDLQKTSQNLGFKKLNVSFAYGYKDRITAFTSRFTDSQK